MSDPLPASNPRGAARAGRAEWWRPAGALERFLADLLFAEAHTLRPGGPWPPAAAFRGDAALGEGGLDFDSLECLAMAAALGEALFLHHGGLDDALVIGQRLHTWSGAAAAALERFSACISFRSSGSTGPQRRHKHALADLEEEAAFFAAHLLGRRRVLVAVPCHHIYGFLFSLLLPARLGIKVIDIRHRFPSAVTGQIQPGDLVVGHPGFWSDMVRAAPSGWPAGVIGISSGAHCPEAVAEAVRSAGLSRLIQVYGASETAGIAWRDTASAPYALLPWWSHAEGGTLIQRGTAPPLQAPDLLRWLGPRHVMPDGRRDSAVQVGGLNVYPARVKDMLLAHESVAEAAVRLMAPHEGDRLKAFVVPRDEHAAHDALRDDLYRYVRLNLSVAEQPRAFSFGPSLPATRAGKPCDWPLPALVG